MISTRLLHRCELFLYFLSTKTCTQDYANPETSRHIINYPEECDGPKGETWQFNRWKEIPRDLLTPMFVQGSVHYYVNELAQTKTGKLFIPVMWIIRNKVLCADAHPVHNIQVCDNPLANYCLIAYCRAYSTCSLRWRVFLRMSLRQTSLGCARPMVK